MSSPSLFDHNVVSCKQWTKVHFATAKLETKLQLDYRKFTTIWFLRDDSALSIQALVENIEVGIPWISSLCLLWTSIGLSFKSFRRIIYFKGVAVSGGTGRQTSRNS